jgi:hypothetical protein
MLSNERNNRCISAQVRSIHRTGSEIRVSYYPADLGLSKGSETRPPTLARTVSGPHDLGRSLDNAASRTLLRTTSAQAMVFTMAFEAEQVREPDLVIATGMHQQDLTLTVDNLEQS